MKKPILVMIAVCFVTFLISCKNGAVIDNSSQIMPTISVTSPLNNSTVVDSVLITITTSNDSAMAKVEFYVDGVLAYTSPQMPWQYNWSVRTLAPNTTHTIQVKAYTKSNSFVLSQLVTVYVQQTLVPTISITTPINGSTVVDSVLITAATSNDSVIVKVEFYIDGVLSYASSTTPWQFYWNVRSLTPSTNHTIQVKAYTKANNMVSSQIVNVTTQQTQEFIYPLTIGNCWKYRSYLENHITAILHAPYTTGIHTWTVTSQSSSNDSIFYRIEYVKQDTQRYRDDTTFVSLNPTSIQFSITKTKREYIIDEVLLSWGPIRVPRYVLVGTDTLIIGEYYYSRFLTNYGLLHFSFVQSGNNTIRDSLDLISFVKK